MARFCDHTTVGVVVRNQEGEILMVERRHPPYGWAPLTGHVDKNIDIDGYALWEDAAQSTVQDMIGAAPTGIRPLGRGRRENECSREGGDWHEWVVFEAIVEGDLNVDPELVLNWKWAGAGELDEMQRRTEAWHRVEFGSERWREEPGLDPTWYWFFRDLGIGVEALETAGVS